MKYDDEMTERAAREFARRQAGQVAQQPCAVLSERQGDVVTLANVNGPLARYRVRTDAKGAESLRFLK